ncbi:MAG: divergent PAP2 family protein [Clostridia bacterium]
MDQLILKYLILTIVIFLINFLFTMIYTQLFKTILKSLITGKLLLKTFISDGDFPSSHTAILISTNVLYWSYVSIILKKIYIVINSNISYNELNLINLLFSTILCITALIGIVLILYSFYEIHNATNSRLRVQEHAEIIYKMLKIEIALAISMENKEKFLENFKEICVDYPSLHENECNNIAHTLENTLSKLILKVGHYRYEVNGGIIVGILCGIISSSMLYSNTTVTIFSLVILIFYSIVCILFFNRKKYFKRRR